jgi:hypothetical protein
MREECNKQKKTGHRHQKNTALYGRCFVEADKETQVLFFFCGFFIISSIFYFTDYNIV